MEKICQSCGMPLEEEKERGTNSDGSINGDYCIYCFKDGEFTNNMTLEETIADSVNYAELAGMTKEAMLEMQSKVLPTLKRWVCTCTNECATGYNPNCTCANPNCHCADDNQ